MGDIVYRDFSLEDLESIMDSLNKEPGKDSFVATCYCSFEEYQSMRDGYTQFNMAMMREIGRSDAEIEQWKEDEFKRRNNGDTEV